MSSKISYRPEIDGLRCLAVLAVVIYHAEFAYQGAKILQGGFLGVDVFFVISGYLITSLIIAEYRQLGRFSLSAFYERRARRLLPALLTVMLVSTYFAYQYLFPTQLLDYAKSVVASLFFVANFYWDATLQAYGAESGTLKPFLHTWSLAVEEQYYLIFPLLLVAFYKRMGNGIMWLMLCASLVSLVFAHVATLSHPSFSFFHLPSRLWELLAGGILGIYHLASHARSEMPRPAFYHWLPKFGLLILLGSFWVVSLNDVHPGLITVLPVTATLLIIAFANSNELTTRLLSSKPFIGVGLISYSLYLWHYPIFAFTRVRGGSFDTVKDKLELIALAVVLSALTYFLIEKPFRNRQRLTPARLIPALALAMTLVIGATGFVIYQDQQKERFTDLVKLYGENEYDNAILKEASISLINNPPPAARFTKGSDKIKIFILGNSHAKDMYNAFAQNLDLFPKYQFEHQAYSFSSGEETLLKITRDNPLFQMADVVLVSNRYLPGNTKYQGDVKSLPMVLKTLLAQNKKVIVASNTVEFKRIEGKQIFDWYVQNTRLFNRDDLKTLFYENINPAVKRFVNDGVGHIARINGVKFLRKEHYICDHEKKQCDGVTPDGFKSFYDKHHYTLRGAKHFGQRIAETGWLSLD